MSPRRRDRRPLTPVEIKSWVDSRIEITTNQSLLYVHKYDNGLLTKEDMMAGVREEVRRMAALLYDTGFADGVNGSVDVEDEDSPFAFEIEEEEDENGTSHSG